MTLFDFISIAAVVASVRAMPPKIALVVAISLNIVSLAILVAKVAS